MNPDWRLAVMNGDIDSPRPSSSPLRAHQGLPIKFSPFRCADRSLLTPTGHKSDARTARQAARRGDTIWHRSTCAEHEQSKGFNPTAAVVALAMRRAVQACGRGAGRFIAMNAPHDIALMKSGFYVLAGPQTKARAAPGRFGGQDSL